MCSIIVVIATLTKLPDGGLTTNTQQVNGGVAVQAGGNIVCMTGVDAMTTVGVLGRCMWRR